MSDEEFAEVEVLGHDDPILGMSQGHQVSVIRATTGLGRISRVMTSGAERLHYGSRTRFIDQELGHLLGCDDLMSQVVRRECQSSRHVLWNQARVLRRNLGSVRAARAFAQQLLHSHPGAADYRLAAHHGGVDFDAGMLNHK